MSVSDPLLKQLKALTLEFRLSKGIVNDKTEKFESFCEILEKIFRKGLKQNGGWFSKTDYWCWINKLLDNPSNQRMNPIFSMVTDIVKECKKVTNHQGRGRLFIRYALVKKILGLPVELLMKNRLMAETWYHPEHSILGNEILSEIFISLLFEITEIRFLLNLKNSSFLDETWMLPVYKDYELVPCDDIGMTVQYLVGRTLVRNVVPGSVAEEDGKIGCGDVLDELFGISLRDATKTKVQLILRQNNGWPIRLAVTKCHTSDGCIYPPIEELMILANMNRDQVNLTPVKKVSQNKESEFEDDMSADESEYLRPPVEKGRKPAHALLPFDDTEEIPVHGSDQTTEVKTESWM